ncbi:MAG: hypothetical protein NT171_01990 [Planctomycetota bacterium]|nr:hypothetical protein [Planctomycetota bacterium]
MTFKKRKQHMPEPIVAFLLDAFAAEGREGPGPATVVIGAHL